MVDSSEGVEDLETGGEQTSEAEQDDDDDRPSDIEEILGLTSKKSEEKEDKRPSVAPPRIKDAGSDIYRPPPPPSIAAKLRPGDEPAPAHEEERAPSSMPPPPGQVDTTPPKNRPQEQAPGRKDAGAHAGLIAKTSPRLSQPPPGHGPVQKPEAAPPKEAALPAPPTAMAPQPAPPSTGRTLFMVALLAVAALAVLLFVRLNPQDGTLIVTVAGPGNQPVADVKVTVDGRLACEQSPCVVGSLTEGPHLVHAEARGFPATADQAIAIVPGKQVVYNLVLSETRGAAEDAVDDSTSTRVTLRAGRGLDGATVTLDGNTISLPHTVELVRGKSLKLEAERPGYTSYSRELEFVPGQPEKSILLSLSEDGSASAVGGSARALTNAPAATGQRTATNPTATEEASPSAATHTAVATLNLNSIPASTVVLNGRPLGITPQLGITTKPGMNHITFIHTEHGRKNQSVNVPPGGTKTVAVKFP